MEDLPRNWRR